MICVTFDFDYTYTNKPLIERLTTNLIYSYQKYNMRRDISSSILMGPKSWTMNKLHCLCTLLVKHNLRKWPYNEWIKLGYNIQYLSLLHFIHRHRKSISTMHSHLGLKYQTCVLGLTPTYLRNIISPAIPLLPGQHGGGGPSLHRVQAVRHHLILGILRVSRVWWILPVIWGWLPAHSFATFANLRL